MIEAAQTVEATTADRETMHKRHEREHTALLVSEYGTEHVHYDRVGVLMFKPHRKAEDARSRATLVRTEADEPRSLGANEAVERIEAKNAERERRRHEATERERQLPAPFEHDPGREGPPRSL